jgi:antitoxin (DNA-binding transcriptional repressor) of toxin-antitoxin stability system
MYIELYIPGGPMEETSFTDLRNQAKHYFDLVEAGEPVRVLRNGRAIADIVPVRAGIPSWKRREARPQLLDGASLSRLILEDRQSEV